MGKKWSGRGLGEPDISQIKSKEVQKIKERKEASYYSVSSVQQRAGIGSRHFKHSSSPSERPPHLWNCSQTNKVVNKCESVGSPTAESFRGKNFKKEF